MERKLQEYLARAFHNSNLEQGFVALGKITRPHPNF